MDMAVANLLKHKIRFELESEDSDYLENRFYSKGRQYCSRKIKNVKSLGARSLIDLCLKQLQPFYLHVFSSMIEEIHVPIHHMEIKTIVSLTDGACGSKDLFGFTMDNPTKLRNYLIEVARYKFTILPTKNFGKTKLFTLS